MLCQSADSYIWLALAAVVCKNLVSHQTFVLLPYMRQVSLNFRALTGNIARQGGAVYLSGDSSASCADCAVRSNSAAERGSALRSVDRAQVSASGWRQACDAALPLVCQRQQEPCVVLSVSHVATAACTSCADHASSCSEQRLMLLALTTSLPAAAAAVCAQLLHPRQRC
jgi:hypothetical protein